MSRRAKAIGAVALAAVSILPLALGPGTARAAESIDALRATDAELTKALGELEGQIRTQQADVDAAAQSVAAADQTVKAKEGQLAETQGQLEGLRKAAAQRAVQVYMRPAEDNFSSVLSAGDFKDAERRSILVGEINSRGESAIDELVSARALAGRQKSEAEASRTEADARRVAAQQKLDQLNAARATQLAIEAAIQDRIANAEAEAAAAAAVAQRASNTARANRSGGVVDDSRISASGMVWPISGPVRSPFGARWGKTHTGIDIGGAEGDPIRAAKAGVVKKASFDDSGYGNFTVIDNGNGVETWYAHQSKLLVKVGQSVDAGQQIGNVGHTGRVVPAGPAGAHLHLEVRIGGTARDPQQYLP